MLKFQISEHTIDVFNIGPSGEVFEATCQKDLIKV